MINLQAPKRDNDAIQLRSHIENIESLDETIALDFKKISISSALSDKFTNGTEEQNRNSDADENFILPNCNPDSIEKLYPHLYSTILQGQTSLLRENANQSLAALFPSVLTAEGPKCKTDLPTSVLASTSSIATTLSSNNLQSASVTSSVAAELSQALSTALSLSASEVATASNLTAACKDTVQRSETAVTETCSIIHIDNDAKNTDISAMIPSNLHHGDATSSICTAKKRKHQTPRSISCTSTIQAHSTNVTSPLRSMSESTSSSSSVKETTRQEIGPATLGDALQQKIRETQAKIKSNVISASSSQSLLPPGKCNSHHNHQTGSKELNQLLHQHYCGRKAPKAPSASAVRKGKVPPPPGSNTSPNSVKSSPVAGSEPALETSDLSDKMRHKTMDPHPEDCDR